MSAFANGIYHLSETLKKQVRYLTTNLSQSYNVIPQEWIRVNIIYQLYISNIQFLTLINISNCEESL
jgi:hypothetical protein